MFIVFLMNKVITGIIIALIIGGVAGYSFRGNTSSQNPKSSEDVTVNAEAPQGSREAKIQEALSAAPEKVAKDATVMDYPEKEGASPAELQKGTNDWTCFPDYPASPGKDPMCVDKQGMEWLQAYITQKTPSLSQVGLAYMLEGGSDASNTDPFAQKPTEGDDWITTPSHTMVFPAGKLDTAIYGTDPNKGGPWIMWAGTPYEHLMIPVK